VPRSVGDEKEIRGELLLVLLRHAENGRRMRGGEVDGRLEPRQVGDQPRLAREVLDLAAAVLLDERPRFGQPAQQLLLGLRRHRDVDVVDGRADRQHRQQGAPQEDAVGQRGKEVHRRLSEKFSSTSPPASGTVTRRDSSGSDSFQTNTL
jgi:hypothetical protein